MKSKKVCVADMEGRLDPVGQVPIVDAYMRWVLHGAEEVFGEAVLSDILQKSQLEQLIGHYPEESLKLSKTLVLQDYANLSAAMINRAGVSGQADVTKVGRLSVQPALKNQGKLMNFAARNAIRFLPMSAQIKTVLSSIKSDVEKVYANEDHSVGLSLEDRGNTWAYIDKGCACCVGKTADQPICWLWTGTLEESLNWLTGKEFNVDQVACRAMGQDACVWEVDKRPL